jgi:hypothetical protein
MQQLSIERKNKTTDQVVENTNEKKKDRRPGKGRTMVLSRRIYRLQNTDNTFFVESETSDDHYYCVKYNPSSVVESWLCSCKDNSTRHIKCKHLFAIEFAIKWGIIKDIDKLPSTIDVNVKLDITSKLNQQQQLGKTNLSFDKLGQTNLPYGKLNQPNNNNNNNNETVQIPKSYLEDDYDF